MSRRKGDEAYGKALDLWQAPANAGEPLVCIATSYTFDATFFETECIGRFLQMEAHPSESASVAYLIEREEKLAGARVHALVDRRHARDKESLRWDIIGVLLPHGVQHAKLAVLVWQDVVRIIIGSGNLTVPGYRKNVEVFGTVDLTRESGNKPTLSETLDFVEQLASAGVGAEGPSTPKGRLRESISTVRQHTRTWRGTGERFDCVPVFNGPADSAIAQVGELWPSNSPPREAYVVSPFFDHPPNDGRAIDALKALLAKRGENTTSFYVKTEVLPDGRTRVYAPKRITQSDRPDDAVYVYGLSTDQQGEQREVHSKLLSLGNDQWRLLMVGSSNFTAAGLGVTRGKGNFEANLVYRLKTSDISFDRVESIWPDAQDTEIDVNSSNLLWEPCFEEQEEGAGVPPLPGCFEEALFEAGPDARLRLALSAPLPSDWSIRLSAGRTILTSGGTQPGVHSIAWGQEPPPFVLEVAWRQSDGADAVASWPVNVANPAALPPPDVLRTLTLEELLEILASTRPLPDAVRRAIEKRSQGRSDSLDSSLDPLRRLDSQAFLLRRTKRVARALDRLRERLERPALTKTLSNGVFVER